MSLGPLRRTFLAAGALFAVSLPATAGLNEWTTVGPPGEVVNALVIDPASAVYAGTNGGILKSTDGGTSWSATAFGFPVFALAIDPSTPSTLYAGTLFGVFKSTDGGGRWTSINSGLSTKDGGPTIFALAVAPGSPSTVYAGAVEPNTSLPGGPGVFKTTDGGASWTAVNNGLPFGVAALAVDPTSPAIAYAGTFLFRHLGIPLGRGVYKTVNGGMSWTRVLESSSFAAGALAIDPSAPSSVYFAAFGGLFKSTDGGATWRLLQSNLFTSLAIDPTSPSSVLAGALGIGVFRSTDRGNSWMAINNGLRRPNGFLDAVMAVAIDPGSPSTLYAGTRFHSVMQFTLDPNTICTSGPSTLCLNDGRFRVQVNWSVPSQGTSDVGTAIAMTGDTGAFWFFSSNNVEVVVKVVDGRAFNGKFWVFSGALSDVEYTITVTDTITGNVKIYFNPQGQLASVADTAAF